jgi:hypothetical protein
MWDELATIGLGLLDYDNQRDTYRDQMSLNQLTREDQRYYFDQTMDYSIQRRAADARAAGISPLAAMGSAPASMPNIQLGRVSTPRSPLTGISDALSYMIQANAQEDLLDKQIRLMQLRHDDRNGAVGYKPGNDLEGQMVPRPFVSSEGEKANTQFPPGTPGEVFEQEFGELGNIFSLKRALMFAQQLTQEELVRLKEDPLRYAHPKLRMYKDKLFNYLEANNLFGFGSKK